MGAKKFYSYKSLDLQRLKEITQFYGSSTAAIWAPAAGALSAGMKVALMTVSGGMMSGYGELLDGTGFETLLTAGINPVAQFREAWALNESRLSKDQVLKNQFKGLMALEKVLGKIDARAASRRVAQDQSERSIVKDVPVKVTPTKQRGSTTSKQ